MTNRASRTTLPDSLNQEDTEAVIHSPITSTHLDGINDTNDGKNTEASNASEEDKPSDAAEAGHQQSETTHQPVFPEPASDNSPATILQNRPFILKTLKFDRSERGSKVTGSILSQSLDKMLAGKDAKALTMAALRKLVPEMSRYAVIEKFCTPSGTMIDDESISIIEYLQLEGDDETLSPSGTPSLKLFFCATKLGESAGKGVDNVAGSSVQAPNLSDGPGVRARAAPEVQNLTKADSSKDLISNDGFDVTLGTPQDGAGKLSETQWAVVLRNCAVFYGWIIDPRTKRLVRAPKPAFQLRSKVNLEPVSKIPDFVPAAVADLVEAGDSSPNDSAAPRQVPPSTPDQSRDSLSAITPKSDQGIPKFRVNDDSRIEITAHEDELTVAMARSDFSEQSTEASASGGGWGVSVGLSAGMASNSAEAAKMRKSSTSRTLVARYMFPRCDLILWPDEMEPSPDLAELLDTIRMTKNIKMLRKLHAEYGNLFCQNVTLGGRLLSTKIVHTTENQNMDDQKQSFKTAVGASVSGSFAGFSGSASAKHDEETGGTKLNESSVQALNEAAVFEAVGGETILATNPKAWSPTVASHELWRVINREGLSPLVEVLSGMPGYEAVQSWFAQAVPALSRYITLDEAHGCKARLRVMSPTNSLSITNINGNASFYLGHDPSGSVTPRLNHIHLGSADLFWCRIDMSADVPIFNPTTYRAPALFGYDNFDIGGAEYGSKYNQEFVKTEWDIVAPFDEELKNGTRIILRSCLFKDGTPASTPASHMVVFRNAQGEFIPAMSDSDEYQYWRIIKMTTSEQHIKPGDNIRLCWDFRDQTTGWRDFSQDSFGRRQTSKPAGFVGPLFLKVPWPRFEVAGRPTALIMSPDVGDLTTRAVYINYNGTPKATKYTLQDLNLRIDRVTNDGRGDADDYLLSKVQQEGADVHFEGLMLHLNDFPASTSSIQIERVAGGQNEEDKILARALFLGHFQPQPLTSATSRGL